MSDSDINYNTDVIPRRRLREATVKPPAARVATDHLRRLTRRGTNVTVEVAIALAMHLCHVAGGDGRGVFVVMHDPEGDRVNGHRLDV